MHLLEMRRKAPSPYRNANSWKSLSGSKVLQKRGRFGEFPLGAGGLQAGKPPTFKQNIVSVAMKHQALALDFHRGNAFRRSESLDSGDFNQPRRGVRDPAEAVAPGFFQGGEGISVPASEIS